MWVSPGLSDPPEGVTVQKNTTAGESGLQTSSSSLCRYCSSLRQKVQREAGCTLRANLPSHVHLTRLHVFYISPAFWQICILCAKLRQLESNDTETPSRPGRSGRPSRGPADPAEVRCWSCSLVSARADLSLICWRLELVSRHFSGCLEQLSSVSVAFSVIQTKPLLIPLWTASAASICLQHLFCARKCVNLRIKQSSCRVSFSSPGSCRQQTCWLLI